MVFVYGVQRTLVLPYPAGGVAVHGEGTRWALPSILCGSIPGRSYQTARRHDCLAGLDTS